MLHSDNDEIESDSEVSQSRSDEDDNEDGNDNDENQNENRRRNSDAESLENSDIQSDVRNEDEEGVEEEQQLQSDRSVDEMQTDNESRNFTADDTPELSEEWRQARESTVLSINENQSIVSVSSQGSSSESVRSPVSSSDSIVSAMRKTNLARQNSSSSLASNDSSMSGTSGTSQPIRYGSSNSAQQNLDAYIKNSRRGVTPSGFLQRRVSNDDNTSVANSQNSTADLTNNNENSGTYDKFCIYLLLCYV